MNNLILASALALSSIVAPAAAHADGRIEFGGARFRHGQAAYSTGYAPVYAPPAYVPPVYVSPPAYGQQVYLQPNGYAPNGFFHRDDRGERREWREHRRFEGGYGRDGRGWQFSHGREGWRR